MGETPVPSERDEQLTLDDADWTTDPARRFANLAQVDSLRDELARRTLHDPRRACPSCGGWKAYLKREGSHDGVYCADCGTWNYWAPGAETGRKPRTVANLRKDVSASQRARILNRDNARCVLCGVGDGPLHVGHLLSVEDGIALGAANDVLNDDANLAAMCETCNLGLRSSVDGRTYAAIMWRLLQAERRRASPAGRSVADVAALPSTTD
jgi:hypothetical protein